jgi:hypothetical protein
MTRQAVHFGAVIAIVLVAAVFVVTLVAVIYCRMRVLETRKENEVATLDSINMKDSIDKVKLNPLIFNQDRAQKFRVRARSTSLGRPQFTLSKKSIEQASKNTADREACYWYSEFSNGDDKTATVYSESDIDALEKGEQLSFNRDYENEAKDNWTEEPHSPGQ